MEQNSPAIGVQTIEPQPQVQQVQPNQISPQIETQPPKKKKSKALLIFVLLFVCLLLGLVIGGVVAFLNIGQIVKGLATIKADSSYTTVQATEMAEFDLDEFIPEQELTVDENNEAIISLAADNALSLFGNKADTSIGEDIALKIEGSSAHIQIEFSKLLSLTATTPVIGNADAFKDVLVAADLGISSDKKSFSVSNMTLGHSLADMVLPKDASTKLSDEINSAYADLTEGLKEISISEGKINFVYEVTPLDFDNASSLVGEDIPLAFDYESVEYTIIDSGIIEYEFTPKQWVELLFTTIFTSQVQQEDFYVEIQDDQLIYYMSVDAFPAESINVLFEDPSRHFFKALFQADNTQGLHAISAGFGNDLIDNYFIDGLFEEIKGSLEIPLSSTIVKIAIENNTVVLRIRV